MPTSPRQRRIVQGRPSTLASLLGAIAGATLAITIASPWFNAFDYWWWMIFPLTGATYGAFWPIELLVGGFLVLALSLISGCSISAALMIFAVLPAVTRIGKDAIIAYKWEDDHGRHRVLAAVQAAPMGFAVGWMCGASVPLPGFTYSPLLVAIITTLCFWIASFAQNRVSPVMLGAVLGMGLGWVVLGRDGTVSWVGVMGAAIAFVGDSWYRRSESRAPPVPPSDGQ